MQKDFLGRGWRFPFRFDPSRGSIETSEFEDNIRQCITIILGTKPGERQMLPQFGCRIHELVFAPNTRSTSVMIAHYVEEALARWEPRITVTKVESWPDPGGTVRVMVHYTVRATQQEDQVDLMLTGS